MADLVRRSHQLLGLGLRQSADRRRETGDQPEATGLARPDPTLARISSELNRRPVCRATNSTALQKQAA